MPAANYLPDVLETTETERLATGFKFTEGPLWDPAGFYYFVDLRSNKLYKIAPGGEPELVRETKEGNGTTFDLQGRIIHCEHNLRAVTRFDPATGKHEVIADRYNGGRLNKPNDVVCHSDGSLFFTDPEKRVPFKDREVATPDENLWDGSAVYRLAPDGSLHQVALCEYPNGLAFSPDERTLYVANTRSTKYIHALEIARGGKMTRRRIFADLSEGDKPGIPDGLKVDSQGRVYCTGPGGIWVLSPEGRKIGVIEFPEQAVNFAFGGPDLKTLFCCAHTSVYTLRVTVPGNPHPWYRLRK